MTPPPLLPRISLWLAWAVLAGFLMDQALRANNFQDFFIYRAGAARGLAHQSPYEPDWLKPLILEQYPEERSKPEGQRLAEQAGFFLPPGAILVFAPFAILPYGAAKVAWALVNALAAWGVLGLLGLFGDGPVPPTSAKARLAVAIALWLNFMTIALLTVGQTTLLFVGSVAFGQWLFERDRPVLGVLFWAIPFIKPHLALMLLPVAWYVGGWRRAAAIIAAVAGLNLAGAWIASGSMTLFQEYLAFLDQAHKAVDFNKAQFNPQITSWNRIWIAAGGEVIELTGGMTLAGYAMWYGMVLLRCGVSGRRPSPAWALAASAAGAIVCCQVLGYEAYLLVLTIPYLRDLLRSGGKAWAVLMVLSLFGQVLPLDFESLGVGAPRALFAAVVATLILLGPLRPQPQPPGTS